MATDIPPRPDCQPDAAVPAIEQAGEQDEPTRGDRAKAAFKVQRGHARARIGEWLAATAVTEDDLYAQVLKQRADKRAQREIEQQRHVARLHAEFNSLEREADANPNTNYSGRISNAAALVAGAETRLEHLRNAPEAPITGRDLDRVRHTKRAGRAAALAVGGLATLPLTGAAIEQAANGQPMILAVLGTAAGYGWYLVSRPFVDGQPVPAPMEQLAAPVDMVKQEQPGGREFNAPPPPALTVEELDQALRNIGDVKPNEQIQILAVPQRDKDGNTTVVFDLPPRVTVAELKKRLPKLAGALKRDASMVDIQKAGSEGRVSFWMTDRDPFEEARPSPLLKAPTQLDAWKDGVPVAWNKRGAAIRLAINNQSYVIAGTTRSGKGVGASNLVVGASFDPRINLRIVAGKNNGEWDPYAKAGVASTYFKPSPERLLALLEALLADKDRRERDLGKLGKSKLVGPVIEQIGGIELLVIDELATYTRPGKPLRDEILEALIELSAVAAGAGILMVLITQYPEVDVIPTALAMNCGARWAMRVLKADHSNAVLGGGQSGAGRDASKFDPPRPGLGWLVNPFADVIDLARSFDLDEDERGEITGLLEKSAKIREKAGRLAGQWEDPIERHLLNATGLSSAAGGPKRDGVPGRNVLNHTPKERMQMDALRGCLKAMDELERDVAQLDEMAEIIGGGMASARLSELLRAAGAGGTIKIVIPGRSGQVRGYQRKDIEEALALLLGE